MGANLRKVKPPKIKIELDKPRTLMYDLNAFAELEDIFGSVDIALQELAKGKMKALRAILYAGLVHEDDDLTPKKVGSMIGLGDLTEIGEALNKAIVNALPENEEKKDEETPDPNVVIPPQEN